MGYINNEFAIASCQIHPSAQYIYVPFFFHVELVSLRSDNYNL